MRHIISLLLFVFACGAALSARAVSVAELQKQLAGGQKITVIDIRPTKLFAQGHIPGAISVPASLCPQKHLPPLGKVVIYDDGLGRQGTSALNAAAAALAAKPGITVDVLQGGFAAWESGQGLTTRGGGLKVESVNYITYSELQAAGSEDVVLVDLRKLTGAVLKNSSSLTDLTQEFPGWRVDTAMTAQKNTASGAAPLLVLIDSADGTAEAAARLLKAQGIKRYAILVGGELAIQRKGRPGLGRSGPDYRGTNQYQYQPSKGQTGP